MKKLYIIGIIADDKDEAKIIKARANCLSEMISFTENELNDYDLFVELFKKRAIDTFNDNKAYREVIELNKE